MLFVGLVLLAISILTLWLCAAGKRAEKKSFLRGGADVLAAIIITSCFGVGIVATVAGFGQWR